MMDPASAGKWTKQLHNAQISGNFPLVSFEVCVKDSDGNDCLAYCWDRFKSVYNPCKSNVLRLSTNSYYSAAGVTFRKEAIEAVKVAWTGGGTPVATRKEDYMIFVCMWDMHFSYWYFKSFFLLHFVFTILFMENRF